MGRKGRNVTERNCLYQRAICMNFGISQGVTTMKLIEVVYQKEI